VSPKGYKHTPHSSPDGIERGGTPGKRCFEGIDARWEGGRGSGAGNQNPRPHPFRTREKAGQETAQKEKKQAIDVKVVRGPKAWS